MDRAGVLLAGGRPGHDPCSRGGRVLVVGSINVDLVVSVQRLPAAGETVVGGRFATHGGGKGANQAVAAARAGASVTLLGAVGDDAYGREALDELRAEGVDVGRVEVVDGPTGIATIVVDAEGANQIAVASGANAGIDGPWVRRRVDGRTAAVVVVNHELAADANLAAVEQARASGGLVVLNPAPARPLDPRLRGALTLLTPNRTEAAGLTGEDDPSAAAVALATATGAGVAVTLGADGAVLAVPGQEPLPVPAPRVAVVDTTGAGDVFTGTVAAVLAAGGGLAEAVQRGVAVAATSVTVSGARGAPPRAVRPADT